MAGADAEASRPRAHPPYLYARLLGGTWAALPEPMRRLHSLQDRLSATGRASVERGEGLLSRLVGGVVGFPPAAEAVDIRVDFERRGDIETWRRSFGGHAFTSTQQTGRERRLVETFGPASFAMALIWDGARLNLRLRRWWLFGWSMPFEWGPLISAHEEVVDGRFTFFVEIRHPWTGLIVRYRGWLEPIIFA